MSPEGRPRGPTDDGLACGVVPLRRVVALLAAWAVVLGLARGVVALPETCPPVTGADAHAAAVEAVAWMERNQRADGRWVYRYDREADAVDLSSHAVRHSGVAMSLYQAHAAGIGGALDTADAGVAWSLGELVRHDGWAAVRRGDEAPTGATALLVAGLSIRRSTTGDGRFDDEMTDLGRFLVAMTEPSGAVVSRWDAREERPVVGEYSPFFTGETYFALALLAEVDPAGGWGATAERIGRYLAIERDDVEDRFPPTSDHWAAYGLTQVGRDGAHGLDDDEVAYARRLAGIFGIQVRYESQRTGEGLNRWLLRGPRALGAGVGTLGEGLGALWSLASDPGDASTRGADALAGDREAVGERLRCVAGMLVDRQVTEAGAAEAGRPQLAQGAWFRMGVTQMDDQQHALSALLLALPALAEHEAGGASAAPGTASGGGDGMSAARTAWLGLVALATVNPARVRRLGGSGRTGAVGGGHAEGALTALAVVAGAGLAAAALAVVVTVARPLLDAAEVSASTGLVAAGLVVVLTAAVDAVRRPAPFPAAVPGPGSRTAAIAGALVPVAVPALVRPAVALLIVAVAADAGPTAGIVAAAAAAAGGPALLLGSGHPSRDGAEPAEPADGASEAVEPGGTGPVPARSRLADGARWAFAALAIVGGVDLVAHGVLGV